VEERSILVELASLIAQAIRFIRLPLDMALAVFDGLQDEDEDEIDDGETRPMKVTGRQVLGFGKMTIGGEQSMSIRSISNALFRPDTLLVDPMMAPSFMIEDIQVASRSQLISKEEIPAMAFSGTDPNCGHPVKMDVCLPGQEIMLIVRNVSSNSRDFAAAIWGSLLG
jgi:hypothetical protein